MIVSLFYILNPTLSKHPNVKLVYDITEIHVYLKNLKKILHTPTITPKRCILLFKRDIY